MHKITLSPRLELIASLVPVGSTVADVGTDHGYIPVWILQNGIAFKAAATDINIGPLTRAQTVSTEYGLDDKIKHILCDGLKGLKPNDADTVIIAGMGGETIMGILASAPWTRQGTRLILQPQSKQPELRKWLFENGYAIDGEYLVRDAGKIYTVLTASGGDMCELSVAELYTGRVNNHCLDSLYLEYLDETIYKLRNISMKLCHSEKPEDKARLSEYRKALDGIMHMKGMLDND